MEYNIFIVWCIIYLTVSLINVCQVEEMDRRTLPIPFPSHVRMRTNHLATKCNYYARLLN